MTDEVVICSAVRTPIGRFGRGLKDVPATRLGAIVIKEALGRAGLRPDQVDEVIMGNAISAGIGQNPARQSAIFSGIPSTVGAFTVNKVCGSGLKAVMLAAQAIRAGDADVIVAGGMENMSASPHLIRDVRWGVRQGNSSIADAMIHDGLWDVYNDFHMAFTGERVAAKFGISREEADLFSLRSNQRAYAAARGGRFREQIVPVETGAGLVEQDECIRGDSSLEILARLQPIFKKDGILTAGNCSKLSDGAAALIIASGRSANELGLPELGHIIGYEIGGGPPEDVMEAPIPTVRSLLDRTGIRLSDIDLVEHNEAYAPATIVVGRKLGVLDDKINVNGGAVAMGHPIGCSGARILVTLLYALKDGGHQRGIATLCMGGGNALAMLVGR